MIGKTITYKNPKSLQLSFLRTDQLYDESPLCISKVTGQPAHSAADSNTI